MSWILDLSILLSICRVYIRNICSADYAELPVLLYQVSTSMLGISHAVLNEKKLWNLHTRYRVISEVLVISLLVVVHKKSFRKSSPSEV